MLKISVSENGNTMNKSSPNWLSTSENGLLSKFSPSKPQTDLDGKNHGHDFMDKKLHGTVEEAKDLSGSNEQFQFVFKNSLDKKLHGNSDQDTNSPVSESPVDHVFVFKSLSRGNSEIATKNTSSIETAETPHAEASASESVTTEQTKVSGTDSFAL